MALTNINFVKHPELHSLILNTAVDILREGYQTGGAISEEFYDSHGYPLDQDVTGQVWHLTGTSEIYARSKPLYTKIQMDAKRKAIKDKQQEMQRKQNLLLVNAENILNNNKACEE
jgi:hypothetical protein